MKHMTTRAYCLGPEAISALEKDGLGWGHDLDCGCLRVVAGDNPARHGFWSRFSTQRGRD